MIIAGISNAWQQQQQPRISAWRHQSSSWQRRALCAIAP